MIVYCSLLSHTHLVGGAGKKFVASLMHFALPGIDSQLPAASFQSCHSPWYIWYVALAVEYREQNSLMFWFHLLLKYITVKVQWS